MHAVLPTVKRQSAAVRVDTASASWSGHTELHVVPPSAGATGGAPTLGLHCYGLRVTAVTVNGHPATFKLQPPVRCAGCTFVACWRGQAEAAAAARLLSATHPQTHRRSCLL